MDISLILDCNTNSVFGKFVSKGLCNKGSPLYATLYSLPSVKLGTFGTDRYIFRVNDCLENLETYLTLLEEITKMNLGKLKLCLHNRVYLVNAARELPFLFNGKN